jgi:LysM domain
MSPVPEKSSVFLAGLAAIVVVGLATPAVLGAVTVSLLSHGAIFNVHGLARVGVFALDAVAWVAWVRIIVALCFDVASGLRQRNSPQHVGGFRGHLAGWVLGFLLLVLPSSTMGAAVAGAATVVAPAPVTVPAPGAVATPSLLPVPVSAVPSAATTSPVATPVPVTTNTPPTNTDATYTVATGDCLSTIALRFYGDEGAWTEIWAANADRTMADGVRFGDPNLIYAGWILILPGLPASSPTEPAATDGTPSPPLATPLPAGPMASTPHVGSPGASGQRNRSGLGDRARVHPKGAPLPTRNPTSALSPRRQSGTSTPGGAGGHHGETESADAPTRVVADSGVGALVRWVPESASLGLSALVAAAYLRRIRRRRAQARADRGDDEVVADPDPSAVVLEARLTPFADAPVLEWLELANRHLTAALRAEGRADAAPLIRVVRVGPAGVEMLLDEVVHWAPGSFTLADDGSSWRLSAEVDRAVLWPDAREELAWLPLLLPVGDDASGTYLLHLGPGDVVSLEGPEAPSMLAAWVQAAKSWPWAEQMAVARDAETAQVLAPLFAGQVSLEERATVLFSGDASLLSEPARSTVASVTSHPDLAATRVKVASEEAFIEPFGIAVRPCLLDSVSEDALERMDGSRLIGVVTEEQAESDASVEEVGKEPVPMSPSDLPAAGSIEVQLLTFTPQIIGLTKPLPSNMAVRITELVSWLALQGSKGTTSAAMLDHGIVGATSTKTLYNMVSAARGALGTDGNGAPRLITDRSTGVYRLADEVTVDVLRFVQMVERGIESDDLHVSAELCREALNLIHDTPVGNGSGRYGWWSSLWEARVGRLATKAAGRLAELARNDVIDIEVARAGIDRARLAADGEGELHRVAMVLEAWAGNDDRVEREWAAANAQAEEIEAGAAPNAATERTYARVRK